MFMMKLQEYLSERIQLVEAYLEQHMPQETIYPEKIHEAMRYSVFAGGKRLRPVLTIAACEAVGGTAAAVLPAACALELIHTYSLVHDDLPAMDNDDYRRGRLTNHKVYGEAMAILAGDGLLTLAFNFIAKNLPAGADPAKVVAVIREVSEAAGTLGMIGGQVVDMESENKQTSLETLNYIHHHKTGALFKAAVRAGGILAGAANLQLAALTDYAENLGLAFQITDDILDVEGDSALLGKPVGSDEKNNKATYPALIGLEQSKKMAEKYVAMAGESLRIFGENGRYLKEIATYLLDRKV
jgi:geranylgeranyl diphosphate synthase type II